VNTEMPGPRNEPGNSDENQSAPQGPVPTTTPAEPTVHDEIKDDEKWLENFYGECGREVTLAYTTLNQMKNWAIVIAGAVISGLAFSGSAKKGEYPSVPMFVGTIIVYIFILRFYIRAILCYTNLLKWNKLQSGIVELRLLKSRRNQALSDEQIRRNLADDIRFHYFEFLPTVGRKTQLLSNLKLGFYPLFTLALFFLLQGAISLWSNALVKALTVFAVFTTVLEGYDFFTSGFFDDVNAWKKKKAKAKESSIFPVPKSRAFFFFGWLINLAISGAVASWSMLWPKLQHVVCGR
jgi:hypothetical protein